MGKYKDHRDRRRREFQDDGPPEGFEPSYFERQPARPAPAPAANTPVVDATVRWFNAEKGFGFLQLGDGTDAFLHVSRLQALGRDRLPEGAALQVRVEPGAKGPQVSEVVSISSDVPAQPSRPAQPAYSAPARNEPEQDGTGSVKRYDAVRGFGFIGMDGGGKDVFVHASVLQRSGLTTLDIGQRVSVTFGQTPKGLEARAIRVI